MKKQFLIAVILATASIASAQEAQVQNRFALGLGVSDNSKPFNYLGFTGNNHLNLSYELRPGLSVGTYFGAAGIRNISYFSSEGIATNSAYYYGLSARYDFSDLLFANNSRFSIYLKGTLGGYSVRYAEEESFTSSLDYGLYLGASYYFSRRLGLYAEIGYGRNSFTHLGLCYRIGRW